MRIAIILENKSNFPFRSGDPRDLDSELFSDSEEDALLSGLRDAGHTVVRVGDGRQLIRRIGYWRHRCDLAFNLSVGYRGIARKSHVPGVLELAGIPYIGSDAYSLSLTRHKYHAKLVAEAASVTTAPSMLWTHDSCRSQLESLPYPVLVKPVAESSSIGIEEASVAHSPRDAEARAKWVVATLGQPALIEMFVRGVEVEVPMLGWPNLRALGVATVTRNGQILHGDAFLTSEAVYAGEYDFSTDSKALDEDTITHTALAAARALGIRDYGRIDLRIAEDGTPYFMEASTHPHIQPHSSFYAFAKERGLTYAEMLDEIVATAAGRVGLQSSQNSISQ